ncbi:hypothetical protein QTH91_06175 [Variovorax dokdonensis]|uniref:Uncharacterized protein n=1 Tax=Variovorax dokdonensis TaxID=344883 RepID=A0ABT7N861_9BURK|nr:hypothetical protein [Variovorax dokdonensis]MDM0044060.1 hypothetical protein [Variovorax dokdonensis]
MSDLYNASMPQMHRPAPEDPGEMPVEPDQGPANPPAQPQDPEQPIAPPH